LKEAVEADLDLVEIASLADPPVVKIVDFKKFKYEEGKKERKAKSKTHQIDTKEIWLSPTISEHDLEIRVERAKNFLTDGDRVKFTVKFPGRSIAHPEIGREVINRALGRLSEIGEVDGEARMMGRALTLSIKPVKK
jgi:translation initiation factor IF-3